MSDRAETLFPALVALGLLMSAATLVIPWWTVEASGDGASVSQTARPFSTGGIDLDFVSENGVIAVGVLALVGVLSMVGGLALWGGARQDDEAPPPPSPWLSIAGGALMVIAALVAVATWPNSDLGFWGSLGGGGGSVNASAAVGWYLALIAGAVASAGGFVGLGVSEGDTNP